MVKPKNKHPKTMIAPACKRGSVMRVSNEERIKGRRMIIQAMIMVRVYTKKRVM
jgi:hypothetical protein